MMNKMIFHVMLCAFEGIEVSMCRDVKDAANEN